MTSRHSGRYNLSSYNSTKCTFFGLKILYTEQDQRKLTYQKYTYVHAAKAARLSNAQQDAFARQCIAAQKLVAEMIGLYQHGQ